MGVIHRFPNVYLGPQARRQPWIVKFIPKKYAFICLSTISLIAWFQLEAVAMNRLPVGVWNPPLEPPIRLINQYRQPNSDYSAGHRGIDYLVSSGQAVLAPADGQVWFSGWVAQRPLLSVLHQDGYLTEFEPVCTDLPIGEPVFEGQEIGKVCPGGATYLNHCPGALCMHFSLRSSGAYLSPLVFIGGLNPSRLLPTP